MDPEPSMLQAARVAAAEAHVDIEFIEASSYDLDPQLGMFQVVTIGRAFHLDGPARRARQAGWAIEPNGALVLFNDAHPEIPENL
jgi:2-polyprenyl-3-methyl-5-hydroxy-6-metoxy-1,4-benzoquinol methylase